MRIIFLATLLLPCWGYTAESISCHFDKFHQANHEAPEISGYAAISQSLEIIDGKTSEETLKMDGKNRAANSLSWIFLEPKGWYNYSTTYAGDFGELLTIEHELGENTKKLNGWFKSSIISSNKNATHTSLGKCLVR